LKKSVSLKVREAYSRDAGRGVARIDYDIMDEINASTGDIIEIKGKRRTVAKCLPLYPADEGKGIIRIDGLGRNNLEVAFGDTITIQKINALPARIVVVAPLEAIPPIDEQYIADALYGVPLIKGDNVMVPYFGGRLLFQVIGATPTGNAVMVAEKTIFHISEKRKTQSNVILQSNKRARMIFSLMTNQDGINILRILNLNGSLTYSKLKSLAGLKSKKESEKFAYHLKKLLQESLVDYSKSERRYTIASLGKVVCDFVEEIEKR